MKILWALLPVLAVVGIVGFNQPDGDRQLQVIGGRSTISFYPSLLQGSGLRVSMNATAEGDASSGEQTHGFAFAAADLRFTLKDGSLKGFDGGAVSHKGGFVLSSSRGSINANGFTISPTRTAGNTLEFKVGTGKSSYVAFELSHARTTYDVKKNELSVGYMDATLTVRGAQQLGRPELAGSLIGTVSVYANSEPIDGGGDIEIIEPQGGEEDAQIDVALSAMSSLTSVGHMGTFPNGVNGLSMQTTSCNVGTGNIPWFAPMDVRHPVIAMNLYRINNGRFEQVGWSWLKHGFLSTNSGGCGACQNPGTGTLLGVNCSDTYGTGNNSDRKYLGGRDEVNPFTGIWTCQNSYFSNYQNDCIRRNDGTEFSGNPVAHRLEVLDADLGNANSQYFYEAYYINANDFDKYNNIGSRGATMTWNAGLNRWDFTTISAQVQGPAINRWGELRSTATPQTEGDVIVAVQTTNLGGGMWHYEYAVYNHDLDRQVREFSVPVPSGATVQNVGFRDIDQNATNQWGHTIAANKITWSTGTFGSGTANPLKYSSVFNFRFDCNVAPANATATLGLFKPGTGTQLTSATKGPLMVQPVAGYTIINGVQFSGNLASLGSSDNNRLEIGPTGDGSRSGTGIETTMSGPGVAVNSMVVVVESSNTLPASPGGTQTIQLWNWTTSAWELLDTRPTTIGDSTATVTVSSNASRFVEALSREVKARIMHVSGAGETGNRWRMTFDQVGIQFN